MTQASGPTPPVPLTILTGFLGAGKTTLLNHILRGDHGLRVAVLVNDFGAINIDAELVVGVEDDMVNLANGCICCTIRDDLLQAAQALVARPDRPEYLIIEGSGVSDPLGIVATFQLPEIRPFIMLDSIIAVVDAVHATSERRYADLLFDQILAADIVVLNKIDLVDSEQRTAVRRWIERHAPRVRILEAAHGVVPLNLILGGGRYRIDLLAGGIPAARHEHDHGADFQSWSFFAERPFLFFPLRAALMELPPTIYRAKGILAIAEHRERRAILQLVGSRIELVPEQPWGDELPHSRLVLIGSPGLDLADLQRRFDRCLTRGIPQSVTDIAWEWVRHAWGGK